MVDFLDRLLLAQLWPPVKGISGHWHSTFKGTKVEQLLQTQLREDMKIFPPFEVFCDSLIERRHKHLAGDLRVRRQGAWLANSGDSANRGDGGQLVHGQALEREDRELVTSGIGDLFPRRIRINLTGGPRSNLRLTCRRPGLHESRKCERTQAAATLGRVERA